MVKVAKRPTPAARPSTPSMRLKALVQPTSQSMVTGMSHQTGKWCQAMTLNLDAGSEDGDG